MIECERLHTCMKMSVWNASHVRWVWKTTHKVCEENLRLTKWSKHERKNQMWKWVIDWCGFKFHLLMYILL
jgi:hypothetical protein